MEINRQKIGLSYNPYIIAELSANHNGSLQSALEIVRQAKLVGASAVKLQTYTADTITLKSENPEFFIEGGIWEGQSLYELYEQSHMPWNWHKPLFELANDIGITIFSSPFDYTAVDLLEDLNAPAYKIASFEAVDLPLIRYAASTGKPLIISTGMASRDEIIEAIDAARSVGCSELAILHCVSGYPAPAANYNLSVIPDMRDSFGVEVGLSDHTLDNTTAIASVALGASIIEKHFTLNRNGGGPDDSFSLEPPEMRALCENARTAWEAVGKVDYGLQSSEVGNVKFRRSLYFTKDMEVGETVTADCVRSVRPGYGLPPKYIDDVVGSRVTKAVVKHSPVQLETITANLTKFDQGIDN
jgi:N-acetylneuraminate synthase